MAATGPALDRFRQDSAEISVGSVTQAGREPLEAQSDPRRGGRATGGLLANVAIGCAPLPIPSRLFRPRPVAELATEVPKGVPNPGGYPMKLGAFTLSTPDPQDLSAVSPSG